jgi:hypothetical protein
LAPGKQAEAETRSKRGAAAPLFISVVAHDPPSPRQVTSRNANARNETKRCMGPAGAEPIRREREL